MLISIPECIVSKFPATLSQWQFLWNWWDYISLGILNRSNSACCVVDIILTVNIPYNCCVPKEVSAYFPCGDNSTWKDPLPTAEVIFIP